MIVMIVQIQIIKKVEMQLIMEVLLKAFVELEFHLFQWFNHQRYWAKEYVQSTWLVMKHRFIKPLPHPTPYRPQGRVGGGSDGTWEGLEHGGRLQPYSKNSVHFSASEPCSKNSV